MPSLYYDPGLWDELADRVAEELASTRIHLAEGHWKTLEEARQIVGFIRGLEWVLQAAVDLQVAPTESPDDE